MAKKKGQDTEVDMTPMIDCVFLLIIFFVVSTQIVTDVIPLDPPFARMLSEVKLVNKTVINVSDQGVHIGGKKYATWKDFKSGLEARARAAPVESDGFSEMDLYIRGDTISRWKYVQEVLAIANECKIYRTDFAAQLESSDNK